MNNHFILNCVCVPLSAMLGTYLWPPIHVLAQTEDYRICPTDGTSGAEFGWSLDCHADRVAVGARLDGEMADDGGAVYLYLYDPQTGRWLLEQKLIAFDAADQDRFGMSVCLDKTVVIAGAYADDDNGTGSGSAYVFRQDDDQDWGQEAKLVASDGEIRDYFGVSVALSGNVAVIGAHEDDDSGDASGSAYVFRRSEQTGEWAQEAKLLPTDGAAGDYFGYAVDIENDLIVIGAKYQDGIATNTGAAYVFRYDHDTGSWQQAAKLSAQDAYESEEMGWSVTISGYRIVVGAPGKWVSPETPGAAHVFEYDEDQQTWVQIATLHGSKGGVGDLFGFDVELLENTLVVGAYGETPTGAAYLFEYNPPEDVWNETARFLSTDAQAGSWFGSAVGTCSDFVYVGAPYAELNGIDSGATYAYTLSERPPLQMQGPFPGLTREINEWHVSPGLPAQDCYFIYGLRSGSRPVPGCGGAWVDIADPLIFGKSRFGDDRLTTIRQFVPGVASGHRILFQAVEPASCRVTNLVEHLFP